MKLGFLTDYTPEIVKFAAEVGFDCLELFCGPDSSLNLNKIDKKEIQDLTETFEKNGVKVGTLCCSVNHLHKDETIRRENNEYFIKCIRLAKSFGTDTVTTNAWGDTTKTPEENIPVFQEVFTRYVKIAEEEGVKIGLENCPHTVGYPIPLGNIAYAPGMWRAIFKAVPSPNLGLEFDPSHLYWLGVDYLRAIREFAHRIVAVHAKDTEMMAEELYQWGVLGKQFGKTSEWDHGFYRYRIPGWGDINWKKLLSILYDAGFNGPIVIEHEDPVFDGELRLQGLKMGYQYLNELMIESY